MSGVNIPLQLKCSGDTETLRSYAKSNQNRLIVLDSSDAHIHPSTHKHTQIWTHFVKTTFLAKGTSKLIFSSEDSSKMCLMITIILPTCFCY